VFTTILSRTFLAWGQKDIENGGLHLWIQNKNHTWKNVVDGVSIPSQSGTVKVAGFQPGKSYQVEWWNTWRGQISEVRTQSANEVGELVFQINNLTDDLAVRILPEEAQILVSWLTSGTSPLFSEDLNHDGKVNGLDAGVVIANFGRSQ